MDTYPSVKSNLENVYLFTYQNKNHPEEKKLKVDGKHDQRRNPDFHWDCSCNCWYAAPIPGNSPLIIRKKPGQ